MAMFAGDTVLTSAGLHLVSLTDIDVDCPFRERLMNSGGFCKNIFVIYMLKFYASKSCIWEVCVQSNSLKKKAILSPP